VIVGPTADSIRDSIRIRILTPDSIRYSIRTQTADSQVPTQKWKHNLQDPGGEWLDCSWRWIWGSGLPVHPVKVCIHGRKDPTAASLHYCLYVAVYTTFAESAFWGMFCFILWPPSLNAIVDASAFYSSKCASVFANIFCIVISISNLWTKSWREGFKNKVDRDIRQQKDTKCLWLQLCWH